MRKNLFEDIPVSLETNKIEEISSDLPIIYTLENEADFNPIQELIENKVFINIINLGNTQKKYLYHRGSGYDVQTSSTENERNRWLLTPILNGTEGNIICATRYENGNMLTIVPREPLAKVSTNAYLKPLKSHSNIDFTGQPIPIPNTKYYHITHRYMNPDNLFDYKYLYLHSDYIGGEGVKYKNDKISTLGYWEFSPAGEYDILAIKYIETTADGSVPHIQSGRGTTITNPSNASVSQKLFFSEKETVSSLIREPEAISIKTTGEVSEPQYNNNGELKSNSTGTVGTLEFGSGKAYEKIIGDELTVNIPPHTTINVEVQRQTYDVTATYIATVVSRIYGTKFRIKGKYKGRIFTHINVNIMNADNGSAIKTVKIDKVKPQAGQ